jgi:hypothetical protein
VWGISTFSTIAASEQRHVDAVLALMSAYGLADPLPDDVPGVFADPDLQALYDALLLAGSESPAAALRVGAAVEDLDIADLDAALAATANPDLQQVFGNLVAGSENHLRAFVKQLARAGETYVPQFISQERFDAIVGTAATGGRGKANRRR